MTRDTDDTTKDPELHVKTTLRELVIYTIFLSILCVGECNYQKYTTFVCAFNTAKDLAIIYTIIYTILFAPLFQ